jgi:GT2 family glycosyltransferase
MSSAAAATLRALGAVGAVATLALTAHTAVNLRRLRRLPSDPPPAAGRVSVLVPARNEAHRIGPTLASLSSQLRVHDLEVLVLDDGSEDDTAAVVAAAAGDDPRIELLDGKPLPTGWLGKPHACQQLADAATGSVLCFVDADVTLDPTAVAAALSVLRTSGLDAVSPYPRQLTTGVGQRLVQPLIEWSWLTMLPLGVSERSSRPSLTAATGQFFVVDRHAYEAAGGHAAVATDVLDDVALMRAIKRAGGTGVAVDGSAVARCRMYESWDELRDGYTKSLWSAFGSPAGATAVVAALAVTYVAPPLAALLTGSRAGLVGYLSAVAGRVMVARTTGQPVLPDALAHPVSVVVFGWLVARSWRHRRRRTLTWKGRALA